LGFFGEKQDALKALELYFYALKATHEEIGIKTFGSYRIDKIIKPENSSCCFYENIEEFMVSNPYVVYYLEKYDPELLENTKKLLEELKTEAKQNFTHPNNNLTEEEDNFC